MYKPPESERLDHSNAREPAMSSVRLGYANVAAVVWVLINDQAVGLEAMLRNVPSLIRCVPKPIRRILGAFTGAFTTHHNFIIGLETPERSVFAVFAYSNHYAQAPDSTPTALIHLP
jgi:hypothetical protein